MFLAQGNSKRERELRARERRVEFAARLRASMGPQILHAVLGTWLLSDFDPESNLHLLADQTDAPQAGELVAWSMMFLTTLKPMDHANPEGSAGLLSEYNSTFEDVLSGWLADPTKELDFRAVRGHTVEAVKADDAAGDRSPKAP